MKYTFKEFQSQYPDDDACLDSIMQRRFGNDPVCPGCGIVGTKFHRIAGRRAYACQWCGHHVYPCAGTIFEHSSTPLSQWFHAMYLMTATRNGVSAKEIQRQLGVTYKCAWRIGHQLRLLMSARDKANTPPKLSGHGDTHIDWRTISTSDEYICSESHNRLAGLQFADITARAFAEAVEPNIYGAYESSYALSLKPRVYNKGGNYGSYGVKVLADEGALDKAQLGFLAHFKK